MRRRGDLLLLCACAVGVVAAKRRHRGAATIEGRGVATVKGTDDSDACWAPRPIPYSKSRCNGLGTTIVGQVCNLARRNQLADLSECRWFAADRTKACKGLVDCYLPPICPRRPKPKTDRRSLAWHARSARRLFDGRNGRPPPEEPCVAVHVRRGDACGTRGCFSDDAYLAAATRLMRKTNASYAYLMTDDAKLPFAVWRAALGDVRYQSLNRSVFATPAAGPDELDHKWFPEHKLDRDIASLGASPVDDVLADLTAARRCRAIVGTMRAALTRLAYALMLADRRAAGRSAGLVSLEPGCLDQITLCAFQLDGPVHACSRNATSGRKAIAHEWWPGPGV